MKNQILSSVRNSLLVSIVITSFIGCTSINEPSFNTSRPAEGITIPDNMPILSWEKVDCEEYVILIDGIEMGNVPGNQNWFIPFPLSFGTHEWKVVALRGQGDGPAYAEASAGEREKYSNSSKFTINDKPLATLPENALLLREDWKMISSLLVEKSGAKLSDGNIKTTDWKSTSIPATVLSVLVRNALYPNPYIGTNNMMIPDCSDEFNVTYDLLKYSHIEGENPWKDHYWFRKEFIVPEEYNGLIWLTLGEINYRAEVWLNGTLLADTSEVIAMERQFRFDITSSAKPGKRNGLM
jgi:hypothetical protein